jgi:hypothetical protein
MTINLAALLSFLQSLPVVRNLPTSVKKVLGDILTVAVALAGVLAVVVAVGPTLHVGVAYQSYFVAAASVLSAVIALIRRETVTVAAKQAAAQAAATKAKYAPLPAPVPSLPVQTPSA